MLEVVERITTVIGTVTAANIPVPGGKARCGALRRHSLISESSKVHTFLDLCTEEEKEAERLSNLPAGLKSRCLSRQGQRELWNFHRRGLDAMKGPEGSRRCAGLFLLGWYVIDLRYPTGQVSHIRLFKEK